MGFKAPKEPASDRMRAPTEDTALSSRSEPCSKAWAKAWLGTVVIAFVNGVLHRRYERTLGGLRAHQASSVVLLLLLASWVWRTERRHPLPTGSAAVQVGTFLGGSHGGLRILVRALRQQGHLGNVAERLRPAGGPAVAA
jgi:hypothetical protein